jgi:polynucleotide 5'-hydroxyl-kinase GRC3/NOL9
MDIPAAWEWSADEIVTHKWRKVLVLGEVDRGKSTYCHFLSQRLLTAGLRVAVVDADVGQKDIGPPASITLGYPAPGRPLTAVTLAATYFVGAVSPVGHLLPMVVGTRQLVDAARGVCVIVNTTGFVHGVGRVLKGYKIEALQPDVIVALAQGAELQPLLRAYRHVRTLRLPASARATVKTPEQRRAARERAFCHYFQHATEVTLPLKHLIVQRHNAPGALPSQLLCGLADRRNRGLGLAIIKDVTAHGHVTLLTPVPGNRIRILQCGDLCLSPDGYELGCT